MKYEQQEHYWAPLKPVLAALEKRWGHQRVLDVAPGTAPLPWSTQQIAAGGVAQSDEYDLESMHLPFPDKEFDLVYCRHVIEDMHNPTSLIKEMRRVGRALYIETPSPVAEICRGVDGGSPIWRGYQHHRWFVWDSYGRLAIMPKYPIIEYQSYGGEIEWIEALEDPLAWNTYFIFEEGDDDEIVFYRHERDFWIARDYGEKIATACKLSLNCRRKIVDG